MTQSSVPCGSPPALQAELTASLLIGQAVASDSSFPSAATVIPFVLNPPCKEYVVESKGSINVQSPSAFVTLPGVGASGPVTTGEFLYLRGPQGFQIRLTMVNPAGGSFVSIVTLGGILLLEFSSTGMLTLLEAMGTGVLEYYVNGPA